MLAGLAQLSQFFVNMERKGDGGLRGGAGWGMEGYMEKVSLE